MLYILYNNKTPKIHKTIQITQCTQVYPNQCQCPTRHHPPLQKNQNATNATPPSKSQYHNASYNANNADVSTSSYAT